MRNAGKGHFLSGTLGRTGLQHQGAACVWFVFVAIDLPADIRERLERTGQGAPGKRAAPADPVDPALIHITLKFIGEVP